MNRCQLSSTWTRVTQQWPFGCQDHLVKTLVMVPWFKFFFFFSMDFHHIPFSNIRPPCVIGLYFRCDSLKWHDGKSRHSGLNNSSALWKALITSIPSHPIKITRIFAIRATQRTGWCAVMCAGEQGSSVVLMNRPMQTVCCHCPSFSFYACLFLTFWIRSDSSFSFPKSVNGK